MRLITLLLTLKLSQFHLGGVVSVAARGCAMNQREIIERRIARAGGGLFGDAAGYETRGISKFGLRYYYGERGWKVGSSSSDSFNTDSFRSTVFTPSVSQSHSSNPSNFWVISSFNTPVRFDNREYYWNVTQARESITSKVFCEYQIGEDDGQLQTTTFLDGTLVKSIYFGCAGTAVDCCGMYCCHVFEDYVGLAFLCIIAGGLIFTIILCCCITGKELNRLNN